MRQRALFIAAVLASASAQANEYGHYEVKKFINMSTAADGQASVTLRLPLFNHVLDDLGAHAGAYPPRFDTLEDRHRAEADVTLIANILDPMAGNFAHNPPMLFRLGLLHTIGHNLDLPGSDAKAVAAFKALLALTPDDPRANFRYGMFLAGTTKLADAVPYLEKAKSLGVVAADYPLGVAYAALGNKALALEHLQSYSQRVPGDENATKMIDALRQGNVDVQHASERN